MSTSLLQLPPLSLYIHIPWCVKKCPYCDFNSHALHTIEEMPQQAYVSRLIQDLETELDAVQNRQLQSIFFGGGTPSLFKPERIAEILSAVRERISFAADIEITLEANPGTLENSYLSDFADAGINRLSLGVQSFNDQHLQLLGRIHSARQAHAAIERIKAANFQSFNLDLMHGLPQQSSAQALEDLEQAFSYAPITCPGTQLTLEPNTVFYSKPPTLPAEQILDSIYERGHTLLNDKGYQQYEVSAYARQPAVRARHNLNYWLFGDYIGIGAGAHGKISWPAQGRIVRRHKTRLPQHYLDHPVDTMAHEQPVPAAERAMEFFLNALRLNQGFSISLFTQRTGLAFSPWLPVFDALIQKQWMEKTD